jgi:hypothetical protein
MKKLCLLSLVLLLLPACATRKPVEGEIERPRVILEDGSACVQPDDYETLIAGEKAGRLRDQFQSGSDLAAKVAALNELKPGYGDADAVFYEACKAWAAKSLPKEVFERYRMYYLAVRQYLLAEGTRKWVNEGNIKDPGKLCLTIYPTDPKDAGNPVDARNTTRWVPGDTSVDDCALMGARAGAEEVLLGCTEGKWVNHWAKNTIVTGPWGAKDRKLKVAGTSRAPDPNCAWN